MEEESNIDHPNKRKLDVAKPYGRLTKDDFTKLRAMKEQAAPKIDPHGGDTTSPSSMGIKKPNYATGTPDYAKPKTQTVNSAAKTSLPPGTMKETVINKVMRKLEEKKSEKWHKKQKEIADAIKRDNPEMSDEKKFAIAGGAANKMKSIKEGFNNRHGLSEKASAEEQAVAEQTGYLANKPGNPFGTPAERARYQSSMVNSPLNQTGGAAAAAAAYRRRQMMANRGNDPTNRPTGQRTGSIMPGGARPSPSIGKNTPTANAKPAPYQYGAGSVAYPYNSETSAPAAKPASVAAQAAFDKVQAAKPKAFEFTDAERKGNVSKKRLSAFYKEKGLKSSGKSSQDLRTFMNAAKNKTINTKGVAATDVQKANQSRLQALAPSNAQAQRMRPAGSPTTTQNVSTAPTPTMATATKVAGQMAIDRMKAQRTAVAQTPAMSAGMSGNALPVRTSGPSTALDSPTPRATTQQSTDIARNVTRAKTGLTLPPRTGAK
jgi:hypothetical protein